ncbi:MAG: nuclear transport factor 2 family protein [Actinobacteria bacterium]|nr:nuclear transport factor 2 family protein [Actinomycetota bacterium]
MATAPTADIIEVQQLLARYAVAMTKNDVEAVVQVFTRDGTYSAFGDTYALADFPTLVAAAPKGLFMVGPAAVELDGDSGTGEQPLCFVDQTNHDMRIGWYTDEYHRTTQGWRLHRRAMTFLRRSGSRDSGRPHDPTRPEPAGRTGPADPAAG